MSPVNHSLRIALLSGAVAWVCVVGCSGSTAPDDPGAGGPAHPSATSSNGMPLPTGVTTPSGLSPTPSSTGVNPVSPVTTPTGTSDTTDIPSPQTCVGDVVTDPKRVVRLSFNQISRTIHALLGDELGAQIDAEYQIGSESVTARTFPPLSSPQEGSTITTGLWQKVDLVASKASDYVLAHLTQVTGCDAPPDDTCARAFVAAFAERAYRRPLTPSETESILQVYTEVRDIYGANAEAIQYSVYAILQSPQFLYRTEFGGAVNEAGPLDAYELASALSYFLTDGPPDEPLLVAAKNNELNTREQLAAQADRLLATDVARKNLESAMFSYFQLDNLATVKIDTPEFTSGTPDRPYTGVRESAYRETQLFLENMLWDEPLTALLTAKTSFINETLAPLYGVTVPQQGDENEFFEVELPENRSGLLTQVGFLASNSRPDVPSVVARGLVVNKAMLCQTNPPFPTDPALTELIEEAGLKLNSASEREKAEYRVTTPPCSGCHLVFDAYGLALDSYDIIGRHRTMDPEGRPIDPSVTLPPLFDNEVAADAVEMQTKIAGNRGFDACFSQNMMNWALAEGSQLTPSSCSVSAIVDGFSTTDKTFGSLLREVAISQTFTHRKAGVTP